MNEKTRGHLRDLTNSARAAFAGSSQDEIERNVDAAAAEVRREMPREPAHMDEPEQSKTGKHQPV